jgi:DNA-binding CsgD family transcriptional regulator
MTSAALRIVARTGSAAFARDADGRITTWNLAAERLLDRHTASVLGRPCYEVLAGRDQFGNRYCGPGCPVARNAFGGSAVRPYTLTVADAAGRRLTVRVQALLVDDAEHPAPELIHVLEPLCCDHERHGEAPPLGRQSSRDRWPVNLSPREREVLEMLAVGHGTDDIAGRLELSPHTVRNHVAACLRKLDCHSRLEAVDAARRRGLV